MRAPAGLLLVTLAGCGHADRPQADDPESAFRFSLMEEADREVLDRRVAWRMNNGVTVTAQRIPLSDSLVRERTVADVARSLVRRYELGEVDGQLSSAPCRAAGARATCTMGFLTLPPDQGGERYVRRGVLLEVRDDIVLLEVLGPEALRTDVDRQAELLEETLTVGG